MSKQDTHPKVPPPIQLNKSLPAIICPNCHRGFLLEGMVNAGQMTALKEAYKKHWMEKHAEKKETKK